MQDLPTNEYQKLFGVRVSPTVITSEATQLALDKIFEKQKYLVPCLVHPHLEEEARLACPSSIREIWDMPEHASVRPDNLQHLLSSSAGIEEDREPTADWVEKQAPVHPDSPEVPVTSSMTIEEAEDWYRQPTAEPAGLDPQPHTEEQNTIASSEHTFTDTVHNPDSATPSPENSALATRASSQREVSDSPPSSSCSHFQTHHTTTRLGDSIEGRRAIGRALVSARDRAADRHWADGIEEMRERGDCMSTFYSILSLGLSAKGGVRDV